MTPEVEFSEETELDEVSDVLELELDPDVFELVNVEEEVKR